MSSCSLLSDEIKTFFGGVGCIAKVTVAGTLQFTPSEGALSLPHPILVPYAKHSLKPLQKRVTLSTGR